MNRLAILIALGVLVVAVIAFVLASSRDVANVETTPIRVGKSPTAATDGMDSSLELMPPEAREEAVPVIRAQQSATAESNAQFEGDLVGRVLRCIPTRRDGVPIDSAAFKITASLVKESGQRAAWSASATRRDSGGVEFNIPIEHAFEEIERLKLENTSPGYVARMTINLPKHLPRYSIGVERNDAGQLIEVLDMKRFVVQCPSDMNPEPLYSGVVVGPEGQVITDLIVKIRSKLTATGMPAICYMDGVSDARGSFEIFGPPAVATCTFELDSEEHGSLLLEDLASPSLDQHFRLPGRMELVADFVELAGMEISRFCVKIVAPGGTRNVLDEHVDFGKGFTLGRGTALKLPGHWSCDVASTVAGGYMGIRYVGDHPLAPDLAHLPIPQPIGEVADMGVVDLAEFLRPTQVRVVSESGAPIVTESISVQLSGPSQDDEFEEPAHSVRIKTDENGWLVVWHTPETQSIKLLHRFASATLDVANVPEIVMLKYPPGRSSELIESLKRLAY